MNNKNLKQDLAYEKWLDKFVKEPNSKELEDMSKNLKTPLNNTDYLPPLLGT